MKIALLLVLGMLASGCGAFERFKSYLAGGGTKTCVAGVTYLQFTSGATVAVDRNGKPIPCDE
jgi:hypothetical protein